MCSWCVHLDKGKFAAALVSIGDGRLSVLVHPPLTTQHIVYARGHLLPLIVVVMATRREMVFCSLFIVLHGHPPL